MSHKGRQHSLENRNYQLEKTPCWANAGLLTMFAPTEVDRIHDWLIVVPGCVWLPEVVACYTRQMGGAVFMLNIPHSFKLKMKNIGWTKRKTCCWVAEPEVVALRFMLPVVGCNVLYVLRFAGGPEGKMPKTFCWTTPVDKNSYVMTEKDMYWANAVLQVKDAQKQRGRHCVHEGELLYAWFI